MVVFEEDDNYLVHYGVKRRSGRYPWGSGGTNLSEATDFQKAMNAMRKDGATHTEIAKAFGLTVQELRANVTVAKALIQQDKINKVTRMHNAGMANKAIERETGIPEATVRNLLKPDAAAKSNQLMQLADTIRQRVDNSAGGLIDIGKGSNQQLQITKTKLDAAINILKNEGYEVHIVPGPQVTSGHDTRVRTLCKPGTDWSTANKNQHLMEQLNAFSNDKGASFHLVDEPIKVDPKRLQIVYGPEGGSKADGTIYVRPGAKDLDMGGSSYAQVRIAVGPKHYLKGMAMLKDDLPAGVDLQFHTNKERTSNKLDALKEVKPDGDPITRFGSVYRQLTDEKGKVRSAINLVNDESNWNDWSKSLASQMLSKQKSSFVQDQLNVTYANKKARLEEIRAMTNPVVRKKMLKDFAEDMDSSSIHLKAAALPRQKTHVILPINSLKDNEVYAPGYRNGESVVLIRYPHGGKFEIPELVVNNGNRQGQKLIGADSKAAIGINSNVASKLSGADFDGDTVVVIPNNRRRIQTEPSLRELRGFDPQIEYRGSDDGGKTMRPGLKKMSNTQTEMGKISNLITDMTIAGATNSELARAVRHSMVVIDAEKHGLDHKRSREENGIKALTDKYQPTRYRGANTIISRIGGKVTIDKVEPRSMAKGGPIDPKTGELVWVPSSKTKPKPKVIDPDTGDVLEWERVPATMKVARGSRLPGTDVKDAYDLVSHNATPVERAYADYSNKVRGLANEARKEYAATPNPRINPSAKKAYAKEVESLKAKLKEAQANSPRERHAQRAAKTIIDMTLKENPEMTKDQIKRMKRSVLETTRMRLGAKPKKIVFEGREWEAVQNGAIGSTDLAEILLKADAKQVTRLASPKSDRAMPQHSVARAKALLNAGYTRAEVAEELGVSTSTLDRATAKEGGS